MKLYTDAELAQILDKDIFHLIGDTADELNLDSMLWEDMCATSFSSAPQMILT